jgi:carotenoid cleavage dioxygenase
MNPPLPIDGVLPPDLQGTFLRIGPGGAAAGGSAGVLHAVELRDGTAVSYVSSASEADANVFWHAGSLLALAETGHPQQFSRLLEPEEFGGGLSRPIASHVHRDASTGGRVLFSVEPGTEASSPMLRLGEWDSTGALSNYSAVTLERATWQHDLGVTARHLVFMESPTAFAEDLADAEYGNRSGSGAATDPDADAHPDSDPESPSGAHARSRVAVPFRWTPGAEGWVGVVERGTDGTAVEWIRQDPCLVTHVLGAYDEAGAGGGGGGVGGSGGASGSGGAIVLYVVRYRAPESGQPFDLASPVVGPAGIGASLIGGGLGVLERWRIEGGACVQTQLDDRNVEYLSADPLCEAGPFRYGYGVEVAEGMGNADGAGEVDPIGLLQFDLEKEGVRAWRPGEYRVASEPLFVRAVDGRSDDEGWLLTVVHDATLGSSDLYVLDASSFGPGRTPQAVIHLPAVLPFRSHGTWVGADRYR